MNELDKDLKERIFRFGGVIGFYSKKLESGIMEEFYYAEFPRYRGWPIIMMFNIIEPYMLTDEGMKSYFDERKIEINNILDKSGAER